MGIPEQLLLTLVRSPCDLKFHSRKITDAERALSRTNLNTHFDVRNSVNRLRRETERLWQLATCCLRLFSQREEEI
jgi:hypothetical protein